MLLVTSTVSARRQTQSKICLQLTLHLNPGWFLALRDGCESFPENAQKAMLLTPVFLSLGPRKEGVCDLVEVQI